MSSSTELSIDELSAGFLQIETRSRANVEEQITALQTALADLTTRLANIEKSVVVEGYKDGIPTTTKATLSSIKVINCWKQFH